MIKRLTKIKLEIEHGCDSSYALSVLDSIVADYPHNDEPLTERGMLHWGRGERAAAIEDYLAAIRINPDSKAKIALQSANAILNYYNKDLYNP